jgi:hypothetical protein
VRQGGDGDTGHESDSRRCRQVGYGAGEAGARLGGSGNHTRQKAGALTPSTYITMVAIEIALKTQTLIGGGGYIVIVVGEHDHW